MKTKTIEETLYVYAAFYDDNTIIKVSDIATMESQGWHLIKTLDVTTDIPDVDYADLAKQKRIDAVMAKQEALNAELLEITA